MAGGACARGMRPRVHAHLPRIRQTAVLQGARRSVQRAQQRAEVGLGGRDGRQHGAGCRAALVQRSKRGMQRLVGRGMPCEQRAAVA